MLPALPEPTSPEPEVLAFLADLRQAGFRGEASTRAKDRLTVATDNSVYQTMPAAVVFPTETQDLLKLLRLAALPKYSRIALTPRGAGTGTNGQSLTQGIVVDLSRHMREILEINPKQRWAIVQPGVVLDQLNRALEPFDLRFAPDLSPSNRATLGGMIGTDASGKGSRVYGKTSQHVLELELALADGTLFESRAIAPKDKESEYAKLPERVREIYQTLEHTLDAHQDEIRRRYPDLKRFVTGYNLPHALPLGKEGPINLNPLICGSEGSLAFVTQAKLKLVPRVVCKALWVLTYPTFDAALQAAQALVSVGPGAIETVDDTILALARKDAIWNEVEPVLGALDPQDVAAINLIELWADDPAQLNKKIRVFQAKLEAHPNLAKIAVRAQDEDQARALWSLRKKGVGLLGARPGARRPVAFVEDSVVPPDRLADYIREFRAILDREGLDYGMFGHVDVGCLHVRPALNMRTEQDRATMVRISDEVQALAARFGGVLWGEHGRGYRSGYTPQFFGETLYGVFRDIKALFDPHNQLNPGKIAVARGHDTQLVPVDALTRGHRDEKIAKPALDRYAPMINCNGNAACMNVLPESLMCPSSKVTKDRLHSPKGRAMVIREWLSRLSALGIDPTQHPAHALPKQKARWFRNPKRVDPSRDFSLEVWDAMHGCLACKACTTQCPIRVDIPTVRAEFLAHFYTRYRRPLRDHLIASMEQGTQWMAKAPRLSAALLGAGPGRWLMQNVGGLVDLPTPSPTTVRKVLRAQGLRTWSVDALLADRANEECVVLVQDPVTSFYDTRTLAATIAFIQQIGVQVRVLSFKEHGKGLHVKGMLDRFAQVARIQASRLRALDQAGYTLLGIDPAYTLAYEDDYHLVLGPDARPPKVWMLQAWLQDRLSSPLRPTAPSAPRLTLFGHCTERSLDAQSNEAWRQIFAHMGYVVDLARVGCCGMGGAFGHQREHVAESRGIFEQSWKPQLEQSAARQSRAMATGYSCRSQCRRFIGERLPHPIEILAENAPPWRATLPPLRGKSNAPPGAG